jgi:lysozyme family protein
VTPEFERALARTVKIEGGYVDHPDDRGGPTNLGVTLATLDRWMRAEQGKPATKLDVVQITHETAKRIYFDLYWTTRALPCQSIAEWWEPLARECFDSAVLHGPKQSALFLQRALNLLNLGGKLFPDLKVDGWAGASTLAAIRKMDERPRGREGLFRAVNIEKACFLRHLAMEDPSQEAFYLGWILQRVQMDGPA